MPTTTAHTTSRALAAARLFNSPIAVRPDNASLLVTCESEAHTPRGIMPRAHRISAECEHPRDAGRVVCDAHPGPRNRFEAHRSNRDCVDPVLVSELGAGAEK